MAGPTRPLRAAAAVAAVVVTAARATSAASREETASGRQAGHDGGGGGAADLWAILAASWRPLAVLAALVVAGLCASRVAGWLRAWASRGGAGGTAGAAAWVEPKDEPTVLGLPLGQELFDALFPPVAVPDELACVVCLLPAGGGESCRRLGCGHAFHPECIDGWWEKSKDARLRCPVCRRTQAPSPEGAKGEEDEEAPGETEVSI